MTPAQMGLLGMLLGNPAAYWRVADVLRPEHFTGEAREVFCRIAESAAEGKPYDAVDATDDGYDFAIDLVRNTAGSANVEGWAQRLVAASEVARVHDAGARITTCGSYAEALEILAAVRPQETARVKTVSDGLTEMIDALQARYNAGGAVTGVPTGVESLDALTNGWQPGNLIVLVGETSMGKSALALQSALAAARHGAERGQSVLYFSLEMTAGELTERAVANLGNFPLRWITSPADAPDNGMDYVQAGSRALKELPLLIDDQCGLSLDQIVARATQAHMRKPLALVVVDYMHIMARPRRNDVAELGGIATGLKNLSKQLSVPVMALHQLNRSNAGSASRRPTLFDIRASGEIAETANTVLAVYRSEIARPDFGPLLGTAECLVLKQRQGRRDVRAWMKSRLANMRFETDEAPSGYDETITKDIEPAGPTGGVGGYGGQSSGVRARGQSRPLSAVGGGM